MHVTRADAPEAWRRFVALALDAFRSHASPSLPKTTLPKATLSNATLSKATLPAPPSTAQMTRAMIRLARERGCGKRT
jgi:hypothetical protein